MLLYKINGGEYIVEAKFKSINNIKEKDLKETYTCVFKNDILRSRSLSLIFAVVVIGLFCSKYYNFKIVYRHTMYSFGYIEVLIGLIIIFDGIYAWKMPHIISTIRIKKDKKYIGTDQSVFFYEDNIKKDIVDNSYEFDYSQIKEVYETDTKFIFILKSLKYTFITKDSFVIGDSNSFREFLKNKIDNKATKYIIK